MCEDGAIWAFNTSLGDLSLNIQSSKVSHSINTLTPVPNLVSSHTSVEESGKQASTSTPAASDVSDIDHTDLNNVQSIKISGKKTFLTPVHLHLIWMPLVSYSCWYKNMLLSCFNCSNERT